MSHPKTTCDPTAIERLLGDRLDEAERAAVEEHLDRCAECRHRLERQAAEPGVWQEAREFLSSAEAELPGRTGESSPARASATGRQVYQDDARPTSRRAKSIMTAVMARWRATIYSPVTS